MAEQDQIEMMSAELQEIPDAETNRHLRGEIKVIRRLVKLHVRQLDRADARAVRLEQRLVDIERKLEWRSDRHLLLLTSVYIVVFLVTWFYR